MCLFKISQLSQKRKLMMAPRSEIVLPFKDQIAANAVRRQLRDLSRKICATLQPIFESKIFEQDVKPKESKPSTVSQQCAVYKFACYLCDANYVGYTARHLHQCNIEHKYSVNTF